MNTSDDVTRGTAPPAGALTVSGDALAALILRSATDFAILTLTPDGIISSWSAGAQNVMGWTAAEAVGRPVSLFFTPEDVAAGRMAREMEIARDGGAASDERWHLRKDGTRFWASGEMQPLEEGGRIVGFVKILRDRTEQHALAQRLAAAEAEAAEATALLVGEGERLRELFEAAPGFIAVFRGPTHIFEITNASYRRLIAHRDVIGKPIREGIPEVEGQGYFELFDEVYRTGKPITGHDQPVMLEPAPGAAPVERIVDYVFQPIRDAGGAVTGVFLEGFDTTAAAAARAEGERAAALQAAVLSQLGEGVIATDAEGRIRFVNEAATRLHGVAALDVAPDDYSDTYHLLTEGGAPYPPAELPLARAVLRGETVSEARWRIRRPDGSEVLAIGNAQPVIADGTQVGAVLTVRDDTQRRKAEGALDESRSYLRLLLDSTAEAFYSVDSNGETTLCNAAFVKLLGFAHEEDVLGKKLHGVIHHSHPDGTHYAVEDCPIYRCAQTGIAAVVTNELFYRLDGTPFPVEYRVSPIIRDGEPSGAICTFFDIGERLAAEKTLRETEERYRLACRATNDAVWDWDLATNQVLWNEALHTAFGHLPETVEPTGDWWIAHIHPDDVAAIDTTIHAAIDGSGSTWTGEYRFRRGDGTFAQVLDRGTLIRDTQGRATRMIGAMLDLSERKAAEQALREREAQFRELADNIPTLCWTANADGHIYWYNKRWYEYSDTTPETQIGWGWEAIHDPECLSEVTRRWTHAIATGTMFDMTFPLKGADGTFRRFLTRVVPIQDENGQVVRWFGTNIDVEEQTAAEERLRASEERYRTLFEAIDAGFCVIEVVFDDDGLAIDYRFLEINPAFETQSGLSGAIGRTVRELAPDTGQRWVDLYADVARSRGPVRIEDYFPGLDRWFDVYAYAIDAPELRRVAVLFNDISERKRAEGALTTLNRTLETRVTETVAERDMVWRSSQDLFVICGFDGSYRSSNPAWTEIMGYDPGELIGARFDAFVHPDDVAVAEGGFERLAAGEIVSSLDVRMLHKDGGARWLSWTCVPQGDVFYASGRDVTQRKELEDQLRQSQKMEAVGQLTGGIAHDFNNLLTIVSGNIDMARRSLGAEGDARALRSLGNAAKGADRAAALTQRLLAFSRRQPLQPRAIDVNKLLTGMTELLDRALGETVDLQVVAGAGLWRVEVDPNQLENAILNLAVNARDAMPQGGKLTIETSNSAIDEAYVTAHREVAPGQYVMICVTDTGEGMPADVVAKAFDPFFSTKDVGKGTGLGLSQVYGYVKQSGGHVKIYSEAGEGTTVKVYLPRLIADMNAAEEEEAVPEEPTQGQESILVVEDDDDVRIFTVDSLRELGYRVLEAHDGASALRLLERHEEPPRLLLTDVVMPGMSGRDLADEAGRLYPEMRVLYTTGYARNAIVHGGRLDPGVELLPKPFTFEALAAKIRDVIEKAAVERALVIDPADGARDASSALLSDLGFACERAGTVREALGKLRAAGKRFDVVILTEALPVGNLDAVIAELHAVRSDLPILIVGRTSAKADARYVGTPCVGGLAGPYDAISLRDALRELRVRCSQG